jgi:hypothetical protein
MPKGFTIVVEDESEFVHDALVRRRMWIPKGKRLIVSYYWFTSENLCIWSIILHRWKTIIQAI